MVTYCSSKNGPINGIYTIIWILSVARLLLGDFCFLVLTVTFTVFFFFTSGERGHICDSLIYVDGLTPSMWFIFSVSLFFIQSETSLFMIFCYIYLSLFAYIIWLFIATFILRVHLFAYFFDFTTSNLIFFLRARSTLPLLILFPGDADWNYFLSFPSSFRFPGFTAESRSHGSRLFYYIYVASLDGSNLSDFPY